MPQYSILNSRKRAIIALVHSIAFGLLATYQLAINHHPLPLIEAVTSHAVTPHLAGPIAMTSIYLIVTVVLLILVRYSRANLERLYFAFCSSSAGVGLWRVTLGDPTLHFGSLFRVLMLGCAVITCTIVLRRHSTPAPQFAG